MQEGDSSARSGSSRRLCRRGLGLRTATLVAACLLGLGGSALVATSATAAAGGPGGARVLTGLVRLGAPPRLDRAAVSLGRLEGSRPISLDVALRPRDPQALASFASEVSTPGSPEYRSYLAPGAFAARFGPTQSTVRSTVAALGRLGLRVREVTSNHLVIELSASVATVERAFHTQLYDYRLATGAHVYANRSAPLVPAAIAGGIEAIVGLDDLSLSRPGYVRANTALSPRSSATPTGAVVDVPGGPIPCRGGAQPARTGRVPTQQMRSPRPTGSPTSTRPGDFGAGQTVAVFELEPFSGPNVRTYDECYFGATEGIAMSSPPHLNLIPVDSSQFIPGINDDIEATLDVEEISGFLPQATIDVYEGPNTSTGPLDVYDTIVAQDKAKVITTSWGACEAQAGGAPQSSLPRPTCSKRPPHRDRRSWPPPETTARATAPPRRLPDGAARGRRPGQPALCDQCRRYHARQPRLGGHR